MLLEVYFLLQFFLTCHGYPSLLFTTAKDVRIANITRPNKTPPVIKDLENGAGVDYYLAGGLICWGDHDLEVIQCTSYNGSHVSPNKTTVVSNDIMFPEGLACDWLTQKLYWTDPHKNRLEVVSLDGRNRKILFWQDLDQPRAIALVPTESIMFWTDWGEVPKIERASMDGDLRTRKVIVSEKIFWPNGLTVDFDSRKLYWVDGKLKFIEVMDFDGKNRKMVLDKVVDYPYSLTMFKEKLYWTDWNLLSVFTLDRNTMEHRELAHYEDAFPIDIRVMDSSRQPYKHTPCAQNNGGCSHLCLLSTVSHAGYTCACPTGVKLIDNFTCANGPQQMLLLAQMLEIDTISLDSPDHTCVQVPLKGIKHAIDLSYDPVNGFIYWSDEEARLISRARLDGSNQEEVINTDLDHPDGLAVDWRAENLYWIDAGTDRIQVLRINTTYTKVLVNTDLINPRSIAVSPDEGLMFWSDWNERNPKVERAALDGSGRTTLVRDGLGWPNGITLDIPRRKLYWCDAKTERIEMINYDGRERREVVTDNLPHVFGLTLLGDYLYWTDWQRRNIESAHKTTGANRKVIIDQQANMMGLKSVGPLQKSSVVNPCAINNGNCAHLCLNTPSKPVCTCQMGYEIDSNLRSCVVPKAFLLFARKENIGRISIENAQNDAIIPASGIKDASSLNFDISDNRIYWTDVKAKAITRAFINGSHVEKVIEFGLESPEGLAVDWLANNMYWTDTGTRRIEVSRLNGWYRKAIIWNDVVEPRSIAVHPSEGYIYWSDWGGEGSLNRSRLDGSQTKGLIWSVGRVSSLTLDMTEHRIYWCAIQGFIESAGLDGTRRQTVATSPRPFTLTLYQDKIYWTDWQKGELYSANKADGSSQALVHNRLEQVTSIVVYHDWGQTNRSKPSCYPPCSGLCLGRCSCPTHYTLTSNKTCRPPSSFLLVSTKNTVSRLLLNTTDCPDAPLPIHGLKNIKTMDYDQLHHMLYWIDGGRAQSIKRWRMSAGGRGRVVPLGAGPERAASLAIEPRYRLLYWSCSSEGTINATRLDNGSTPILVIRSHHSEKPKHIAIHSSEGLLFWLSVGRDNRIYRARLDGGSKTTLVSGLVPPVTSLAIDSSSSTLYWMTQSSIESIDFNGKSRREVVRDNLSKVGNLAVSGGSVLWVQGSRLVSHNLATGRSRVAFSAHYPITALASVSSSHPRSDSWTCLGNERVESPLECPDTGSSGFCDSNHYSCRGTEGECIPIEWRCDGVIDCLNSADEASCPPCPEGKFTCLQGQCIDMRWVCDGTPNCLDHSDERDCCMGHECGGHCLPSEVICDGWQNCADGSDEAPAACAKRQAPTITASVPHTSNYLIFGVLVGFSIISAGFAFYKCQHRSGKCCSKKPVGGVMDPALDPLSPNGYRSVGLGSSLRMSTLGGTSSSGAATLCYPANPPPSPATTQRCMIYRPPPPTPCSTDQAHDTDSNYQGDMMEPLPPPPTPTSLSPSSSTYFHPVPPPPSPTP